MRKVRVKLGKRNYDIIIGSGLLAKAGKMIKAVTDVKYAAVITNKNIKKLYGAKLGKSFKAAGIIANFIIVADTEKSKSINTWVKVIHEVTKLDKGRGVAVVAFGGGVIGDLAGFVAAVYKRGVPLIQIPTTLLAQVDSAIGGKTAIDLSFGKNLVGAFYQPSVVISDIDLIKTLPLAEIKNALSEIIKYAIIFDRKFFIFISENISKIYNSDKSIILHIVTRCSQLKAGVVGVDEKELTGYRSILNFGHTIGHALEAAASYTSVLSHGHGVSIGMICACNIAREIGLLKKSDATEIKGLLKKAQLPLTVKGVSFSGVLRAMSFDKKIIAGRLRLILPVSIGHVVACGNIDRGLLKSQIKKIIKRGKCI